MPNLCISKSAEGCFYCPGERVGKQVFENRMKLKNPVNGKITVYTGKTMKKSSASKKGLECDICLRKFKNIEKKKRHVEHHNNMKFQCLDPCTYMFDNRAELGAHLKQVHKTKLSRENEARFMINNSNCNTTKHNENGNHSVVQDKGRMKKKKTDIEGDQGLSSGSEDELDQAENTPGVSSKGSLLNINAVRKGCSTYKTMSKPGFIPNEDSLPDDLIHTVLTRRDHPYSVLSAEQNTLAKDKTERQSLDVLTERETNDDGATTGPYSGKVTSDQEKELLDDDNMSIEIPHGDADYLADQESDISDLAENPTLPEMKSQLYQNNGKNFSSVVAEGTSSEPESDCEVTFKNTDRMFSDESESDGEVSFKRTNYSRNGKENEGNNSLRYLEQEESDCEVSFKPSNWNTNGRVHEENSSLQFQEQEEDASDNESLSCARSRVFEAQTDKSLNVSSSVEIISSDIPLEAASSPRISTSSRATTAVSAPIAVPSTSRCTSSSSGEEREKRKRSSLESDGNITKKSKTDNADEQCCLVALVDAFTHLSREGISIVKQEILRILCNIEFHRCTPSVHTFHVRPLLQNRSSAAKSSYGGKNNCRVPTRTGKPGKMRRHFPVREF